jgi:hypothetical protein
MLSWGRTKHHKILKNKEAKDWLSRNLNNVHEWKDISTCRLSPTKRIGLVQRGLHHLVEFNLFPLWYSWKMAHLAIHNTLSLTNSKYNYNMERSGSHTYTCQFSISHKISVLKITTKNRTEIICCICKSSNIPSASVCHNSCVILGLVHSAVS